MTMSQEIKRRMAGSTPYELAYSQLVAMRVQPTEIYGTPEYEKAQLDARAVAEQVSLQQAMEPNQVGCPLVSRIVEY